MESQTETFSKSDATVDVTQSNFESVLPDVLKHIANCDFIAFDLEFSGSGYKCIPGYGFFGRSCSHIVRNALCKVQSRVGLFEFRLRLVPRTFIPSKSMSGEPLIHSWESAALHGMRNWRSRFSTVQLLYHTVHSREEV